MRLGTTLITVLVVAWLVLWVTNNGVLVYSDSTGVVRTRDCRYLIGVSIIKRIEPLAQRCPVLRTLGK
jgi:hypothetical protein